jgi:hypothetical protein
LQVRIDGRVRWKVGTWVSACLVTAISAGAGSGYGGTVGANGFRFQIATYCRVEV